MICSRVAVLEKKLEVLSAALRQKEQQSPNSPASQPLFSMSDMKTEPPRASPTESHSSSQSLAVNLDVNNTPLGHSPGLRNAGSNTNGSRVDGPELGHRDSYSSPQQSAKRPDDSSSPYANNGAQQSGSAQAQSNLQTNSAAPNDNTMQSSMEYKDISQIREKMVLLWNIMIKNSAARLANVEKGARLKSVTYDTDVVSQGLISIQGAEERLNIYMTKFYAPFPLVEIDHNRSLESLRRESPLLFMTVMSITSVAIQGHERRDACITLHNQTVDCIIYEAMILGNKTLEILKSLILLNMWNNTPETYQHQKSHLITHMCTTMAIDLGLGGSSFETQASGIKYERIVRPFLLLNPRTYECRRIWLCVYISSINVSMILRRPVYLVWSSYTEECCSMLEQPDRPLMDRRVAALARLNHLHEEITTVLQGAGDKANGPPDLNDPRTRCLIRYFEHKLKQISGMVTLGSTVYATALYLVQIYLHEFVMYAPLSPRYGRVPFSEHSLAIGSMKISIHTAQAVGWCYSSSVKCLEIMAALSLDEFAVMPMFCYTRISFCASTLLKLRTLYLTTPNFHQICTVTSSALQPINTIMQKLEQVIESYPVANFAVNFCFVLHVLICHFDRQLYCFFHPGEKPGDPKESTPSQINNGKFESQLEYEKRRTSSGPSSNSAPTAMNAPSSAFLKTTLQNPVIPPGTPASNNNQNFSQTPHFNSNSFLRPNSTPGGLTADNLSPADTSSTTLERPYAEMQPESPLDILSSVAIDSTLQKPFEDSSGSRNGSRSGSGSAGYNNAANHTDSQQESTLKPFSGLASLPLSRRLSAVYDGIGDGQQLLPDTEYPTWLVTDDFWKDLVPGIEALSGFDLY